jgi:dihydrofolate synthase/folylpolyglutamate synthase
MAMRSLFPLYKIHLVFGALADKDVKGIMGIMFPLAEKVYLASPKCERAMELSGLYEQARLLKTEPVNCNSVAQAVELARQNASQNNGALVLIAGSLFVIGEAKAYLENCR